MQYPCSTDDGKDVEIMSPGLIHDSDKRLSGRVVELVAEECEISFKSAGQTTWKRPEVWRGLEADESYFFHADKLDAVAAGKARRSLDIADYPNPDLGIEVYMSPPKIDRPGIYAALKVAEVWRFDGEGQEARHRASGGRRHVPHRGPKLVPAGLCRGNPSLGRRRRLPTTSRPGLRRSLRWSAPGGSAVLPG